MRIIFTQKGLEFRKELKHELEDDKKIEEFKMSQFSRNKKSNDDNKFTNFRTFNKGNPNETDQSFKLPDFDAVKVELIKTSRGEIRERPFVLNKELIKDDNYDIKHIHLNDK